MQISGINGMNNISSIYTYGNSHFNQIQNNPVTPVTKVKSTQPVDGEQDKSKYADAQNVSYNNTNNPYEISKMERDSMILSGMNFDEYA